MPAVIPSSRVTAVNSSFGLIAKVTYNTKLKPSSPNCDRAANARVMPAVIPSSRVTAVNSSFGLIAKVTYNTELQILYVCPVSPTPNNVTL